MGRDLTVDIRILPDLDGLAVEGAQAIADRIVARVAETGSFAISLAGGRTPIALYRCLATRHRNAIPWKRVHFFWSDERYVPRDDPASNYRMAVTELLGRVPVPKENVHPMPTRAREPDVAAESYESTLEEKLGPRGPIFDLSLLGIGIEGHTASLFPGSPALLEPERWVVPALAPTPPAQRLTLTLQALNLAREIFFFVAGPEKAAALARALHAATPPEECPAAGVRPAEGRIVWWVDTASAAELGASPGRLGGGASSSAGPD
jgi:6-phosphogluconolactonase